MRIDRTNIQIVDPAQVPVPSPKPNAPADFGQTLMDALKEVNQSQQDSRQIQNSLMAGQPGVEIHDVLIAAEKASIGMQLTMQVRNKVLESYQEIARMQV